MTANENLNNFIFRRLSDIDNSGNMRNLRELSSRRLKTSRLNKRSLINLSSNDYLGLASDNLLLENFFSSINKKNMIDNFGMSASSSRLLTGNSFLYTRLEKQLQQMYKSEAALVFNSGYHANTGIIPALAGKGDVIFSDKLNHASIIDGLKLSTADFHRYRHNDLTHLKNLIVKYRSQYKKSFIITESIFSMDGDKADLKELVKIKNESDSVLYVDEAHSVGVCGENGLGLCEELNLLSDIDILVGTFGKALASLGAFVICNDKLKSYLINTVRPFIFTTALPPVVLNWNLFILKKLNGLDKKRKHLRNLSLNIKKLLLEKKLIIYGDSHIIPVIIGSSDKTLALSKKASEKGFILFPIRPPTVAEGTSRLRISLNANLQMKDIAKLPSILSD